MALVNYADLDFAQIKSTLKEYLRNNSNFTDYDFEGSNLSSILDILAYNTYLTSYNANMVSNECFIDSATLRENVVALARNIGYNPRSRKASSAVISFIVNTTGIVPAPTSITLNKGPIATSNGTFSGNSFIFSIMEDITVPVIDGVAEFDSVEIFEGTYLTESYTYSSRNPNQRILLNNAGIDTDLIRVQVGTNSGSSKQTYVKQDSLFDINSTSRVYFLQEVEDERYELIFGDGIFGKALSEGNLITINYLTTTGGSSNGINNFTFNGRMTYVRNAITYTISQGISLLSTDIAAGGGDVIEKVDSIKKFAPRIYASQNRALTANDYETLIPAKIYPETESISVFGGEELIPPQYGKVFISIKPRTGEFLPNLVKENIKRDLKKYAVAGIVPEILDLKYLYIEVTSKIYYNSNQATSSADVATAIQNNAINYAESTELNKYGARFKYSKFLKIIDESHESITSNITTVSMRRDVRAALNTLAEYQVGFGNQFHIQKMSGYNIRSSAFRVAGIPQNVYLGDIPNTNRQSGNLFLFSLGNPQAQDPTILRRNVGRIDYVKGVITLNPINIQSTQKVIDGQSVIQIVAVPQSNDTIGLQDLYLQLDINSSLFEMVVDPIASGSDPSASTYIVSSSYDSNRGLLVKP
jgi:hypothetical protein